MAPEVYRKQPYGYAADWWSFGAVSFDLMTNKVPIIDQDYEKPIEFPIGMSRLAKDLLKRYKNIRDDSIVTSMVEYCRLLPRTLSSPTTHIRSRFTFSCVKVLSFYTHEQ